MVGMGHVDVAGVRFELPDGRVLLDDVSFRVGEGAKVALVGANGAGKTTLLKIITGDLVPHAGAVTRTGGLGVMRQLVTQDNEGKNVHDLLLVRRSAAGPGGRCDRRPGRAGDDGERRREGPDEVRRGVVGVGRRRRLRHGGAVGRLHHLSARGSVRPRQVPRADDARAAASRSGWCWNRCCADPTRCCCSTSRTTSSTCQASSGSRSGSASRRRPSCSSATTAS